MAFQTTPSISIRLRVVLIALAAFACGSFETVPVERIVTEATLDSLPQIRVNEGRRLCLATGWDSCPLHPAVANWLGDASFAVWEPGKAIQIWRATDSVPMELGAKAGDNQGPLWAMAVATRGSQFLVLEGPAGRLMQFDESGQLLKTDSLPRPAGFSVRGFVLGEAVMQTIRPTSPGGETRLELLRLSNVSDTVGRPLFGTSLPWLGLNDGEPSLVPLFPPWPSFALDTEGGLVWSPGDRFFLYRVDKKGRAIWTLKGDFTGPAITAEDVARQRQELASSTGAAAVPAADLDSMVAITGKTHPAIAGLVMNRQQELLLVGPTTPMRDSVAFYHVLKDGTLKGRFMLAKRTRVLLFSGDSILVQRPTEGEPWEVRWLRLTQTR